MRKLISIFTALTMLMSCFTAVVTAETIDADYTSLYTHRYYQGNDGEKTRSKSLVQREKDWENMEKALDDNRQKFEQASDGISLMSSEYTEVVYIEDADDLMDIDGHDGGYYELQNDIDISGIEWEPILLTNATFNGNGHSITGLTVTQVPDGITSPESPYTEAAVGLFTSYSVNKNKGLYIYDLNLTDINIDMKLNKKIMLVVNSLGVMDNIYSENCMVDGKIDIRVAEGRTYVVGIMNGVDCESNLDIKMTYESVLSDVQQVYTLYNCSDSVNNGKLEVIEKSNGALRQADVIIGCNGCVNNGNVYATSDSSNEKFNVFIMQEGKNNENNGDINLTSKKDRGFLAELMFYEYNSKNNGEVNAQMASGLLRCFNDSAYCENNGELNLTCYPPRDNLGGMFYLGDASDDCVNNADVNVSFGRDHCYTSVFQKCNRCINNGNISFPDIGTVNIMPSSNDCVYYGDISSGGDITCMSNSNGCRIYGNIYANGISAISGGKDCYIKGNLISETGVSCIENSENSRIEGNIEAKGEMGLGIIGVVVINRGTNCTVVGNIVSHEEDVLTICWATDCSVVGNVSALKQVEGITGGTNCNIMGNITSYDDIAIGIESSNNSYIIGNVISSTCPWLGCLGISNSVNSYIDGNVIITNGDTREGIYESTNCYITGTVSESTEDSPMLSVTRTSPYQGYFMCDKCNSSAIFNNKDGGVHCYSYYTDSNGNTYAYPNYYGMVNDLYYEYGVGGGGGATPDATPAPTPEPIPTPTPKPESYTVCVVDEVSEKPYEGAKVTINGETYETDANGAFVVKNNGGRSSVKVEYGGKVVYTAADFYPIANSTNTIKIKPLSVKPEDFIAGNGGKVDFKSPTVNVNGKESPLMDLPFELEFNWFDVVKTAYDSEEKKFQVLIGPEESLGGVEEDADSDVWSDTLEEYMQVWDRVRSGDITDAYLKEMNSSMSSNKSGKFGIEGDVSVCGFMEISADAESMGEVTGGLTFVISGGISRSFPFPSMPIAYFSCSLSGELGSGLEWKLVKSSVIDPEFNITGNINASLTPSAGVGLGLKDMLSLEVGIEGTVGAEMEFPMMALEKSLEAELSADMYAIVTLLAFQHKEAKTLFKYQIYPRTANTQLMSLDSDTEYEVIGREYLDNISLMSEDPDTVKANVYPYGSVKTEYLSDGRCVMVWLDDDTDRNLVNKTALYYSILENGVWSSPAQIDDDNTADFDFDLMAAGNKVAIVWQNSEKMLSNSDNIDSTTRWIELSYSEFDGTSWTKPVAVTSDNENYEYKPAIYYDGSNAKIAWVENDLNSAIPGVDSTKEKIYRLTVSNGESVSYKELINQNLTLVYDIAISYGGNVAYIADKDGDVTTAEGILYINRDISYDRDTHITGLHFLRDYFYFSESGKMKNINYGGGTASTVVSSGGETAKMLHNFKTDEKAVLYEVENGFSSDLYAVRYRDYEWKSPVLIMKNTEKIRSYDAYIDDSGEIKVASILADVKVSDSGMSDSARLAFTHTEPIEDIILNYILSEKDFIPGKTAEVIANISNNTADTLSNLKFTLVGDLAGELYNADRSVNIKPGDSKSISVRFNLPDDFAKQNITLSVSSAECTEHDITNNSASEEFGKANIEAEIDGSRIHQDGYAEIDVINSSCEDVEVVTLIVTGEDDKILLISQINSIPAGQTVTKKLHFDESYYTFDDEYDSYTFKVTLKTDVEETNIYDNEDYYRITPQKTERIIPSLNSLTLKPGESGTVSIMSYPDNGEEITTYSVSDNESVAVVDENGKITAKGYGSATISFMAPGVELPAKVKVFVRENGTPVIRSAEVFSEGNGCQISVRLDTSECLMEGEEALAVVSVYDEDGTFIGMNTFDAESSQYVYGYLWIDSGKPSKIKVMLWNNLDEMKPLSNVAEYEISNGNSPPDILSADFTADEDGLGGDVSLYIDTSGCIDSGSDAYAVTALYDEEGRFIGADVREVSASTEVTISFTIADGVPESAKVMLLTDLINMTPLTESSSVGF